MAIDKIQRNQRGFQQQVVAPTRQAPVIDDTRTQIMKGLSAFSKSVEGAVDTSLQQKMESDRITQSAIAAKDMLLAEKDRQGTTRDRTLAGQMAYNAIIGKHDTMQAGNDFVEWYRANADADEKTVSEKKKGLYDPLLAKYGTDPLTLKQVSLQVQESQFALTAAQEGIQQEHRQKKAVEAVGISVGDLMADPKADVDHVVDTEIPARARALGLDEFTYKQILLNETSTRAASGDNRLLLKLQNTKWSKGSSELERAEQQYNTFTSRENAVAIGHEKAAIMLGIQNGESWGSVDAKVRAFNSKYPASAFSDDQIASMDVQRQQAKAVNAERARVYAEAHMQLNDESQVAMGENALIPDKHKEYTIKQTVQDLQVKYSSMVASGQLSQADANKQMTLEMIDKSKKWKMKIPELQAKIDAFQYEIPTDYVSSGAGQIPETVLAEVGTLGRLDDSTIAMYATGEKKAFLTNLRKFLETDKPAAALAKAQSVKLSPFPVDSRLITEQKDKAGSAVNTLLDIPFIAGITGENVFGFTKEVPDDQKVVLKAKVAQAATLSLYNKSLDTEANAKMEAGNLLANTHQIFNGSLIELPKPKIAQLMGTDTAQVDRRIEMFLKGNLPNTQKDYGLQIPVEDLRIEVNPLHEGFIITDKNRNRIGGVYYFEDVGAAAEGLANAEDTAKAIESQKDQAGRPQYKGSFTEPLNTQGAGYPFYNRR